jgi:hypothetical protein
LPATIGRVAWPWSWGVRESHTANQVILGRRIDVQPECADFAAKNRCEMHFCHGYKGRCTQMKTKKDLDLKLDIGNYLRESAFISVAKNQFAVHFRSSGRRY